MLCETPVYVCRERACRTIGQYTRDLHDGHKSVNLLYVCETHAHGTRKRVFHTTLSSLLLFYF